MTRKRTTVLIDKDRRKCQMFFITPVTFCITFFTDTVLSYIHILSMERRVWVTEDQQGNPNPLTKKDSTCIHFTVGNECHKTFPLHKQYNISSVYATERPARGHIQVGRPTGILVSQATIRIALPQSLPPLQCLLWTLFMRIK